MQLNLIEARKNAHPLAIVCLFHTRCALALSLYISATLIRPVGHLINGPKCVCSRTAAAAATTGNKNKSFTIAYSISEFYLLSPSPHFPCGFCSYCSFSKHFFDYFCCSLFLILVSVFDKVLQLLCLFICSACLHYSCLSVIHYVPELLATLAVYLLPLSPALSLLSLLMLAPFNYIYIEVRKFAFHCLHSCCTFRCSCNCCLLLLLLLLQFMHILPTNSVVALLWFLRLCATKLFMEGRRELKTNVEV